MSLRDQLENFNDRAARFALECFSAPGCLLGATVATAVAVEAVLGIRNQKQASAEGGFEFTQAPSATVVKRADLTPKQDWCFFDGEKWWLVDDVITADVTSEWRLMLKPLAGGQK